jgi:hypothetical protein
MITTDRNQFIGAHVTDPVKQAVRREAADKKKSMSELIHETLEEKFGTKPPDAAETETATQ